MAIEVEVVESNVKSKDGKRLYNVKPVEPHEQSPQRHWSGGDHGGHKKLQIVATGLVGQSPLNLR